MFASKTQRSSTSATPPTIAKLHGDCVRLVFEQVYLTGGKHLLALSLVSRQFYHFAVPFIYRDVTINLSKTNCLQLINRLTRQGSRLPLYIRTLRIDGTTTATWEQMDLIGVLCILTTNLREIFWNGIINVHPLVLGALGKFPSAKLTIDGIQLWHDFVQEDSWARGLNPVATHLTSFKFQPLKDDQFHDNLKENLISMIIHNPGLKALSILSPWPQTSAITLAKTYPEMIGMLQQGDLPCLELFDAVPSRKDIFTVRELSVWGDRGRWQDVRTLCTRVDLLPAFVGRIPKLSTLTLQSRSRFDVDALNDYLNDLGITSTLSEMRTFIFRDLWGRFTVPGTQLQQDAFPWTLLRLMPNLTKLDIACGHFYTGLNATLASTIPASSTEDIRNLRNMCSKLSHIILDLSIGGHWPFCTLAELARFETDPLLLEVGLHFGSREEGKAFVGRQNCRQAFDYMASIRRSIGLHTRFNVHFVTSQPNDDGDGAWNIPTYNVILDAKGSLKTTKWVYPKARSAQDKIPTTFDNVSDDEMQKKKRQLTSKVLASTPLALVRPFWYRGKLRELFRAHREVERRRHNAVAVETFGENATLYDLEDELWD